MHVDPGDDQGRVAAETREFYRAVRRLYERSAYYATYPLTRLWGEENMATLHGIIEVATDPREVIAAVHRTFMFSVNTDDDDLKNRIVDWYLAYLRQRGDPIERFPEDVAESIHSNPANAVVRDGRRLAPDFLRTLILTLEIDRYCALPPGRISVLELGAGYGGLARTFRLRHPDTCHVILDIPETLYVSATFLRLNFPAAKMLHVTDIAQLAGDLSAWDFVFVPTLFADALAGREFTLFCNTASLGEMLNPVIQYWMGLVQEKISVRYFFGLNRFLNTIDPRRHGWRVGENACSVSFDRHWRILRWELEPPFARCPYLETEVSRNLEIIAERMEVDGQEAVSRSRALLDDVVRQDWAVHYDADNAMKLRDNVLAPDLTMSGTLFALWESIRLDPNRHNVTAMLKYLNTLTRGRPFEEMFYYRDLVGADAGARFDVGMALSEPRAAGSAVRRATRRAIRAIYARPFGERLAARLLPGSVRRRFRGWYYGGHP